VLIVLPDNASAARLAGLITHRGAVYHDDIGLEAARARFSYYPRDVWLYMMASGWARIGQEEHLMGRAGQAGDELGSALIAARLVRDAINLCFLMEKKYAPYAKWFGTAFMQLDAGPALSPLLTATLAAQTWQERGDRLAQVYEFLARKHNALALTAPIPDRASPFWGRPFPVIHGDRFAGALLALIEAANAEAFGRITTGRPHTGWHGPRGRRDSRLRARRGAAC
jgi:hypothetical protein